MVMTGPRAPRWTHIALPSGDIDASIDFYTSLTPLVVVERFADSMGESVWLSNDEQADSPFVLVLVSFHADKGNPLGLLEPFAHLGIEVPHRADVDAIAARARAAGVLIAEPRDMPGPVGYICALRDPDGNVVEISHNQLVYAKVREKWPPRNNTELAEETRAAVLAYLAALNSGDPDEVVARVDADVVSEHTALGGVGVVGREAYRARLHEFFATYSGVHYDVEDLLVTGDRAALSYRMTWWDRGPVVVRGMFRFVVRDELIVHRIDYWDSGSVRAQLDGEPGVVHKPGVVHERGAPHDLTQP